MQRAYRLGLTGGIGSGKSTVAQMLALAGACVIDADAIARGITAPGGEATAPIAHSFGPRAIAANGALDRTYMRQLVFQDTAARQRLEAITHPLIAHLTEQQALHAERHGTKLLVFDIPLLVESGRWRQQLDAILVIDCQVQTQLQRVMARNGLTQAAVESILAAQASRLQRTAAADYVIYNDGIDLAALRTQVLSISTELQL